MANTPKRGYLIPDPSESIFPQIRDMIMAVDTDVGNSKMKTKAGALVDADFTSPVDGNFGLDTTNHRLYVRSGGTWRFLQLP